MPKSQFYIKSRSLFFASALGVLILHLSVAWQPLNRLECFRLLYSNGPLIDDSYIFFKMSRDLADWFAGCMPSFQASSGFQPLIALLYCPLFHFFGEQRELAVHLALSINACLGFLSSVILYGLLCRVVSQSIACIALSIWIWSPYVMTQTVNGMETPLALLLLLFSLKYYLTIRSLSSSGRQWFLLGIVLGVGFWARVDMGLAGLAIAIDQIRLAVQDRSAVLKRMRHLLTCGVAAMAVAMPWMVFTIYATGSLMPVSGKAVRLITAVFFDYAHPGHGGFSLLMLEYFKKEFLLFQPFAALSWSSAWQLCCLGIWVAGLILGMKDWHRRGILIPGLIFQVLIAAAYVFIVGGFWHLNRYFFPCYTLMLLPSSVALGSIVECFKSRANICHLLLVLVLAGYLVLYGSQYHLFFSTQAPARYLSAAMYAGPKIPSQSKIGAFQSGCLSYFLNNQVVNLDGVSNEEAYLHLKNRTMHSYLEEQEIDYIVEEEYLFNMWNDYLNGQLLERYTQVAVKTNSFLPHLWQRLGIYKKK